MTAFDYAAMATTALRLLARFGASATVASKSSGAYNASTGVSTVTSTNNTTTAVVLDYAAKYIDGTLILQGDKRAILASTVAPKQGDTLTFSGETYRFVAVTPIAPAGTPVAYDCQVRGHAD